MTKRWIALCLVLLMLCGLLPEGFALQPAAAAEARQTGSTGVFELGAHSSDMLAGGGRLAQTAAGLWQITDDGALCLNDRELTTGALSALNALDGTAWYLRGGEMLASISQNDAEETELAQVPGGGARMLYVLNAEDFYVLTDDGVLLYCLEDDQWTTLCAGDYRSFVPTPYGLILATGTLFDYDLYAGDTLLVSGVDGYYVDFELDGGVLVYTRDGQTWQASVAGLFDGTASAEPFTGYEIVSAEDLFTNLETPDGDFAAEKRSVPTRSTTRVINRKTLSQGVQNIVRRAYQMTNIQWTPVADITGWNGGLTYKAGTTYTGLPYGQPVYASYVPWSTDLSGFIAAVNNPSSKMYTDKSTYNKTAPYYSTDCSAFVSWAWNLSSRQTTSSIPNFATKVSSSSYTTLEVGDCLCNPGSHVVLVTDITYDGNGAITGIEISEATVNKATNYCCQKTWYGTGYSYALSTINTKYFSGGYSQYRSKTASNATYTHVCEVPLEGDTCSICGYGSYTAAAASATVRVTSAASVYTAPGGSVSGSVSANTLQTVIGSATVDGTVWYQLSNGWIKASGTAFVNYLSTVSITNKSFPTGGLQYGKSFPIVGNVSATNPITKITASIYTGTNTAATPRLTKTVNLSNATGYTLKNSAIDNALTFGQLERGSYTFVIEITERASCAGQSAQNLVYRESTRFSVGDSTGGRVVMATGIDVSHHQGTINWDTVAQNVDFVILRCGYGSDLSSQDDRQWANNVAACERLGIPYGVYLYSYATTDAMALSEAQHVIRLLQGHHPTLPVYYDLEDSSTTGSLSNAQILSQATVFCNAIAAAGYTPGVYSMTSWWNGKLSASDYNRWSRWVAQFASSCTYSGSYDMWQYSDSGSVAGISGNVDMDYLYADFLLNDHTHSLAAVNAAAATCTASGNTAYWYCADCGKYFADAGATTEIDLSATVLAPLGHSYTTTAIPATCLQYEGVRYTCSRCGDSYTSYASDWSNWSTTRPSGVDESKIESRTEYRYRDYTTKTSYSTSLSGYEQTGSSWERTASDSVEYVASWPAGFQTSHSLYTTYHNSPVTATETETNKTTVTGSEVIGYIYWHWCRGSYQYGPINRKTSTTQTSEFGTFHALFSTTPPSSYSSASDNSYNNPHAECCKDTYWYYAIPVTRQSYSTYRKLFTYGKWGSWSSWGTEAYTADSTREVQTRTTYRYVTSTLGDHSWDAGVVTTAPTCTATGVKTYTCTVCGTTKTATVPAGGEHSFVNGVCTQCGLVQGATSLALGGRYVLITQQARDENDNYTATMELAGISTTSTKYGTAADYSDTPNGAYVLTVEQGSTAGTYAFRHGSGSYLAWSSGNSLKTVATVTENSSWTVSFDGEGNATIANAADAARVLQFNASDPRFACYTGTQKQVKLLPFTCNHTETTQRTTDATCTEAGSIVTVCAACGEPLGTQAIPALGHLWGEWSVTTAPRCNTAGVQTRSCSRCGQTQSETVPATGQHSYVNGVCTVCGDTSSCTHPTTETVTDPATCTEGGTQTTVCTVCGAVLSSQTLPALGHAYVYSLSKTPTKTAQGAIQGVCSRCGAKEKVTLPKLTESDYSYAVTQAATCVAEGVGRYTWNDSSYGTFYFDVSLPTTDHSYTDAVTAPTCTAQGYTTHTCTVCHDSYVDSYVPAAGHSFNASGVCTVCGAAAQNFVLADSIAAGDQIIFVYPGDATHDPKAAGGILGSGSKTYLDAVDVTLSGNTAIYGGLTVFAVEAGESGSFRFRLGDDYLTPSTAESGNNYVYLEGSSADWTVSFSGGLATVQSGNRSLKYYYSSTGPRFSAYLSGQKDIAIYKLVDCNHGSTTTTETPTSCTESGLRRVICASCGKILSETVLPATGHSYADSVTQPTCTAQGYTTHTCTRCGDSYTDTPTDALGHSYTDSVTQPTCTAQGYTTHTCTRCGDSYIDTYVDANGHSFVNGTCSVCGARASNYVLTNSIRDGDEVIFVYDGSYYAAQKTPKAAGAVVSSRLSPVAVTLNGNSAVSANALVFTVVAGSESGTYAFVDSSGKYLYNSGANTNVTLNAAETYWTVSFNADSTANLTVGTRNLRYYYTSSSEYFNAATNAAKDVKIYKLGVDPETCSHTNKVTQTTPATCTDVGSQITICADCGTQIGSQTVLPALGHSFTYTVTTEPTTGRTGKLSGTCARCGATDTVTLPKLSTGDYAYAVVRAASCAQTGIGRYTWSANGGFYFDVELPVTGHSYTDTVTAPTCTEQGYTTHVCSVCGDTVTDSYVAANGHSYQNFVCTVCGESAPNFVLADAISAGDQIILVWSGEQSGQTVTRAAGAISGSGTSAVLSAAEAEVQYNAAASGAALVFTVEEGENGAYRFRLGDSYLAPVKNGSNVYQNAAALSDTPTDWTVTIEDGTANIVSDGRAIRFNYNSGNSRFAAYAESSSMKQPAIYKLVACSHGVTVELVTQAADCTTAGSANLVCADCGKILSVMALPALGHEYQGTVTDATCTAAGYITHTCIRCGDSYTDNETPALGHVYESTVTDPTCTEAGFTTHTCTRCGESYTDTPVAALGHDYRATVTAPTCTEEGYTTHVCARCGAQYTDTPVAALGHNFGEDGICTVCGTAAPNYVRAYSLAAGDQIVFVFGGDDSHEPRAAGVQAGTGSSAYLTAVDVALTDNRAITAQALVFTVAAGSAEGAWTFRADGGYLTAGASANTLSLQSEPAEWTVSFADGVPTLLNGTRYLKYYSSNPRFNAYESGQKAVLIYRLGTDVSDCQHPNAQTVTVAATCTQDGSETVTCPDCGTVLSATVIPALGHDYVYAVTTAPTQTAQGRIRGTCSRCGAMTALISIPRLSDTENYTHTVTVEATCTAVGSERYALTGADYAQYGINIDLVLPLAAHNYVDGVCTVCGVTAQNYLLADSIAAGDRIIFVFPGKDDKPAAAAGALGGSGSSTYLSSVDVQLPYNAAVTGSALEFTVVQGSAEGTFGFLHDGTYLSANVAVSGSNYIYLRETAVSEVTDWTVSFDSNNNADVSYCASTSETGRQLRYNTTNPRFSGYVNHGQQAIRIYKLVECEHTATTESVTRAATCTEAGSKTVTCASCGRIISEQEIPALGHDPVHHAAQAATCTAIGWNAYDTCSRCDYTTYEAIPALGHDYTAAVTAPTCTEGGYTTYTCTRCGDSYTGDATAALGHDYSTVITPPTCTEAGYTTHTCTRCGDSYTDTPVAALGHSWGDWVQTAAPTGQTPGEETRTCSVCGETETREIPALGELYTVSFSVPTGVTQPEAQSGYAGSSITLPTLTPPEGWQFAGWVEGTYDNITTAPDETVRTGSYSIGGASVTLHALFTKSETSGGQTVTSYALVESAADVTAGTYVITWANTCYLPSETAKSSAPAVGSSITVAEGKLTNAVTDAMKWTFTGDNTNGFSITHEASDTRTYHLGAYNNSNGIVVDTTGATANRFYSWTAIDDAGNGMLLRCSDGGSRNLAVYNNTDWRYYATGTYYKDVLRLYKETVTQIGGTTTTTYTTEIPCSHDWSAWSVTTAAGCTTAGVETRTCAICGQTETREIAALGHDLVHHDAQAATCTAIGWAAYDTCSRCDYTTYAEIPALGHTPADPTEAQRVEATCTAAGSYDSVVYCAVCHEELSRETVTVPALGHNLVHHDAQAATCTAIGWAAYDTCSRCDYTTYTEIPALGHNYVASVTPPSCTTQGYTTHTCSRCGESYIADAVPALGHDYTEVVTAPTCTAGGYTTYTCTRCGESYITDETAALGHSPAAAVEENRIEPTTTTAGSYDSVVYCTVCGEELSRETVTLDALGVPVVTGYNLALKDVIRVNAFLVVPDALYNSTELFVTLNDGGMISIDDVPKTSYGYKFTQEVPAKNMGDTVTLKLYDGNGNRIRFEVTGISGDVDEISYSVRGYLLDVINDPRESELTKAVCIAMSDYGYYAQLEQGYGKENYASEEAWRSDIESRILHADEVAAVSSDGIATVDDVAVGNASFYGVSLLMKSRITLRCYFILDASDDGSGYTVTIDGKAYSTTFKRYGSTEYYYFDYTGISAKDLRNMHTVVLTNGTNTVTVRNLGPYSYLKDVIDKEKTDIDLVNACKAIKLYGECAYAYFAN